MDVDPAIIAVSVKKDRFLAQSENGCNKVVKGGGAGDHHYAKRSFLFNPQANEFTPSYYMQPTPTHEIPECITNGAENNNIVYYQPFFQQSGHLFPEQSVGGYAPDHSVDEYYQEDDQYAFPAPTIPTLQPFIMHQNSMKIQSQGLLPTPPVHVIPHHQYNPEVTPEFSPNINPMSNYAPRVPTPMILSNPSNDGQVKLSQLVVTPSNNANSSAVYGLLGYVPNDPPHLTYKRKSQPPPMPQQGILFPGSPPSFIPINSQPQGHGIQVQLPPTPAMPPQIVQNINHPPPRQPAYTQACPPNGPVNVMAPNIRPNAGDYTQQNGFPTMIPMIGPFHPQMHGRNRAHPQPYN